MHRTFIILACVLFAFTGVLSRRVTEDDCILNLQECMGAEKRTKALIMRCNGQFAACLLRAARITNKN
ncbi:hypothetical protein ScPMuIL_015219 [Solemya velum]